MGRVDQKTAHQKQHRTDVYSILTYPTAMLCSFGVTQSRTKWLILSVFFQFQLNCALRTEALILHLDGNVTDLPVTADSRDEQPVTDARRDDVSVVDVPMPSRDAQSSDGGTNVIINPPAPRNTPMLQQRRCQYPMEVADVFADRVQLGTTPGSGSHVLTVNFRGFGSGREWLAAWAGNDGFLHETRIGTRGNSTPSIFQRLAVANVDQLWIDGRNSGTITTDRYFLRAESEPTITALSTSWFVGRSNVSYVQLSDARLFGMTAYLGDIAWVPTVTTEDVLGGTRISNARIERLISTTDHTVSDAVMTAGQTLAPQVVHGDSSAWLGFIDDTTPVPTLSITALDRATAAPIGRLSARDESSACRTIGYDLISTSNLFGPMNAPASVESCEGNGVRLTLFSEFARPMPSQRVFAREKEVGSTGSLRARIAFNGAELAVVWIEPGEQNLSVRFFSPSMMNNGSPRLHIRSPEPVVANTFSIQALPSENGAWAVLWSTSRATYISRFGRCGSNPPGEN